jgi:PBP1b-binding outer membrane lipoprotein LpoB
MKTLSAIATLSLLACLAGCGGEIHRDVKRVDPETVVDVDYRFNDSDAREIWQKMSNDTVFRGWIDRWMADHGGQRPTIIVGPIRNNTQDYINPLTFTRNFEREMLNSGRVRVVAAKGDRPDLREERMQGQEWNTPASRKQMKSEQGADLMLMGEINNIPARSPSGRTVVNYYQCNLDLTDLESNEKVWIGSVEIKKVSTDRR